MVPFDARRPGARTPGVGLYWGPIPGAHWLADGFPACGLTGRRVPGQLRGNRVVHSVSGPL